MNDAALVTIIERDRAGLFEVFTSENGFQGHGIVRGLTKDEADEVARALLVALTAKGLRDFDARAERAPSEDWHAPEHLDRYLEGLAAARASFVSRARIDVEWKGL